MPPRLSTMCSFIHNARASTWYIIVNSTTHFSNESFSHTTGEFSLLWNVARFGRCTANPDTRALADQNIKYASAQFQDNEFSVRVVLHK